MTRFRAALPAVAALLLGSLLAVDAAAALTCREWLRFDPRRKEAAVLGMIDDVLRSHRARQYDVNRGALGRCLTAYALDMVVEFDDVCSDSRTADMQAIERVFKTYVWSCAG